MDRQPILSETYATADNQNAAELFRQAKEIFAGTPLENLYAAAERAALENERNAEAMRILERAWARDHGGR